MCRGDGKGLDKGFSQTKVKILIGIADNMTFS